MNYLNNSSIVAHWLLFRQEIQHVINRPQPIRNACGHGGGNAQGLMDANEIVVHVVNRDGRDMILKLLRKRVGQPREAAHPHPHREILPLDKTGADVRTVWVPRHRLFFAALALGRAVALFTFRRFAVNLHQHRVVNFFTERSLYGIQVNGVAVSRQLDAIGETLSKILNERACGGGMTPADHERADQFRIGVHGNPSPDIANRTARVIRFCDVLFLRADERPNFVALNALARQVHQTIVHVLRAGRAQFNQQFRNRILGNPGHANRRTDRVAFDQRSNHLSLFLWV